MEKKKVERVRPTVIDKKLYDRFKIACIKRGYGGKKMQMAIEEAMKEWINKKRLNTSREQS